MEIPLTFARIISITLNQSRTAMFLLLVVCYKAYNKVAQQHSEATRASNPVSFHKCIIFYVIKTIFSGYFTFTGGPALGSKLHVHTIIIKCQMEVYCIPRLCRRSFSSAKT